MYSKSLPAFAGLVFFAFTILRPSAIFRRSGHHRWPCHRPRRSCHSRRQGRTQQSDHRLPPRHSYGRFRRVPLPQHPAEPLPGCGLRHRLFGEHPGRGGALQRSAGAQIRALAGRGTRRRHGGSERRRDARKRPVRAQRRGSRALFEAAHLRPGQRTERRDHAGEPRRGGRFQRLLPPAGRSRANQLLDRRTADLRSAEQAVLHADSAQRHPIDGTDHRRAGRGVRRQDQPGGQRRDAFRTRPEALRQLRGAVRFFRRDRRRGHARPRRQEARQLPLRQLPAQRTLPRHAGVSSVPRRGEQPNHLRPSSTGSPPPATRFT